MSTLRNTVGERSADPIVGKSEPESVRSGLPHAGSMIAGWYG